MTEQARRELTIRLGYTIRCSDFLVTIRSIRISETGQLTFNIVSNGRVDFRISLENISLNGIKFVLPIILNVEHGDNIVQGSSINLGLLENSSSPNSFVYYHINGLDCKITQTLPFTTPIIFISIKSIEIYNLQYVRIPRVRYAKRHREDPFIAILTAEYTIVNNTSFPIRHVFIELGMPVRDLSIRDEKDNELHFFTAQELREIFGEDVNIGGFFVVVDLGEELRPGDSKILRFSGTYEEYEENKQQMVIIELVPNVTENVIIEPLPGHVCRLNTREDILINCNLPGNGQWRNLPIGNNNDICPGISVDVRVDPNERDSRVESSAPVDLQFRAFNSNIPSPSTQLMIFNTTPKPPLRIGLNTVNSPSRNYKRYAVNPNATSTSLVSLRNPSIKIIYSLEIQHRWFWDTFLAFLSAIVGGLFIQELVTNIFSLQFFKFLLPIGAFIGFLSFIIYMQHPQLQNRLVQRIFYSVITLITFYSLFRTPSTSLHTYLSSVFTIYLNGESAILVALGLAYVLTERTIGYTYRTLLLSLIIITILSILTLLPWTTC